MPAYWCELNARNDLPSRDREGAGRLKSAVNRITAPINRLIGIPPTDIAVTNEPRACRPKRAVFCARHPKLRWAHRLHENFGHPRLLVVTPANTSTETIYFRNLGCAHMVFRHGRLQYRR